MMTYIIALVVFFFTALLFDNLPFMKYFEEINSIGRHILYAFQSKTSSDFRKERLMKWYSLRLFIDSIKIVFFISVVSLGAFLLLLFAYTFILSANSNVFGFIITVQGGLVSILAFTFYYFFKRVYVKFRL